MKIGTQVVGVAPGREGSKRDPMPEELVGRNGVVVKDGTGGAYVQDKNTVLVQFDGVEHPVGCGWWEVQPS